MHQPLLFTFLFLVTYFSFAQDEILFSVGDTDVKRSEFEYVYRKNNFIEKNNFSKSSIEDYLTLYISFRLKVKEALSLGYAESERFKDEFTAYEQQLLNSYVDKEILDNILLQEYNRSKKDVELSHIFISFTNDSTRLLADKKINEIYTNIKDKKLTFEEATKLSDDANTKFINGYLGWYNAYQIALPEIEDAAYRLQVGQYSEPVLTKYGWHIVKLNNTREARPKIKVAIIKKLIPLNPTEQSMKAIEDTMSRIAKMLEEGKPFGELVKIYSEDENSKKFNGELDWFGINTYTSIFEETAYSLKNIGDISKPIKTKTAWYIIKKMDEAKPQTFEDSKTLLRTKLQNSSLYEKALKDFINQKKAEYNFVAFNKNISIFKKYLENFIGNFTFKYKDTFPNLILYKMNNDEYDMNRIGLAIEKIYYTSVAPLSKSRIDVLYDEIEKNNIINKYKKDIQQNNAEYKMLIQEYKEGIMIFDISEQKIWNKASEDTNAVKQYFEQHKDKYKKEATIKWRTITLSNIKNANKIYKILLENPNVSNTILQDNLSIMKEANTISVQEISAKGKNVGVEKPTKKEDKYVVTQYFQYIPEKIQSFYECRGYVIADYQHKLEKDWIEALKLKYPVKINQEVVNKLIKN